MKRLISPAQVHKTEKDDVLIYEAENVLISIFNHDEYNKFIESHPEKEQLFNSIYTFHPTQNIYVLKTLPFEIDKKKKQENLQNINLSVFYTVIDENTLQLVTAYIPLHVEEAIRSVFLPEISPIANETKKELASLLKTAPVHSYFFNNTTKDLYFYKKRHEHVPGMMLVEAARQAVYDYVYTNLGHKLNEVSISMSNLQFEFLDYTVGSYPVELLFSHKEYECRQKPKNIAKRRWFYQRGKLTGIFSLDGGIIPIAVFPRLRNERYDKNHHFYPFYASYVRICGQEKKIAYLSLQHITVELAPCDVKDCTEIELANIKFPIQESKPCQQNKAYCHLIFESLSKDQMLALNHLINTSYYHEQTFKECGL